MRNRITIALLLLGVLLLAALIWWIGRQQQGFSWRETYDIESRQPYGVYALHQLLNEYFPDDSVTILQDSLFLPERTVDSNANYFFIGQGFFLSPDRQEQLLRFVEAGNRAVITCWAIPYELMYELEREECPSIPWYQLTRIADTLITTNFLAPGLRREAGFRFVTHVNGRSYQQRWQYISDEYFCDAATETAKLGTLNDTTVNFLRINYGRGQFYIHTNPLLFTNYFIVQAEGRAYSERVFSYLTPGPIYWDIYSQGPGELVDARNGGGGAFGLQEQGPLQFILEQPPLAWAWYLLLGLGLVYLVFRAKRRQRPIPLLPPNQNESLAFLTTIGRLYYQQTTHKKVAEEEAKLFKAYIWERYGLPWRDDDPAFAKRLAVRAGVEPSLVEEIRQQFVQQKAVAGLDDHTLTVYHRRLKTFYEQAK